MKTAINSEKAPAAIGPYSHCNVTEGLIFTSGQLGFDPATGKLREGVEAQAEQAIENLAAVLASAGATLNDVVKTTVFIKNMADFPKVNAIYGRRFGEPFPARSCIEVAALPAGGLVEIEAIASK